MRNNFLVILVFGLSAHVNYVANAAEEFDLTPQEEKAVERVMGQFNLSKDPEEDETVHLTVEMASAFPRSACEKMLNSIEAFLRNPDEETPPEELKRLRSEVAILRQALANQ